MRRSHSPAALLLLCGTAAIFAGCSGAATSSNPPASTPQDASSAQVPATSVTRDGMLLPRSLVLPAVALHASKPGWMSPEAKAGKNVLYVADQPSATIQIYSQKGTNQAPIGAITTGLVGVDGIAVDNKKTLYACNFGGGTVTVYPVGATSPSETLTGAGSPIDVAVANDGTVYVANFNEGTDGTVLVYPKGKTTSSQTLVTFGAGSFPEGLAVDSQDNVYVAFNSSSGQVLKFTGGAGSGTNLGIHVGYVGGLALDKSNDLLLVDQNVPGVDVFPPGATLPSEQIKGFKLAFDVTIDKKNNAIYVSDPFSPPSVNEASYPAGNIVNTITQGLQGPFGVAASPE